MSLLHVENRNDWATASVFEAAIASRKNGMKYTWIFGMSTRFKYNFPSIIKRYRKKVKNLNCVEAVISSTTFQMMFYLVSVLVLLLA